MYNIHVIYCDFFTWILPLICDDNIPLIVKYPQFGHIAVVHLTNKYNIINYCICPFCSVSQRTVYAPYALHAETTDLLFILNWNSAFADTIECSYHILNIWRIRKYQICITS